ncbi:CHASE3 domain-containing protein [Planktothrix agardhii]|uniref:CHASE3 domain-containing protein n=4 Tax=Microcoleaceae TaxID=1892252 RepID=UPI0006852FA2
MQISKEFQKSRWKLGLVIPISLGAIALLNLIMSLIFYLNSQAVVKTMNWVNHTNEVKMRIRSLEKFLVDAETGQRGFIFTGEEEFLESYTDGLKNQESVKIELKNLISDNPEQLQRLAQIELLIKDKFDELAMTINLKRSGKEQELRNLVLSDKGKKIMDELRVKLIEMYKVENQLLEDRQKELQQAEQLSRIATFTGTIVILGLICISIRFIQQGIIQPIEKISLDITTSSSQIATTIEEQERITHQQAISVNQTTATVNELATSSRQMATQAETTSASGNQVLSLTKEGYQAVELSVQGIAALKTNSERIVQQTQDLEKQTVEIGTISNLVGNIAMQTNLLALNAAIEAVRAGEQGQGFGVVASEIRKLADQSKHSAYQINVLVQEIKNSINSTIKVTTEGTHTVNEIMQMAETTVLTFDKVSSSVNNMVLNSQQIAMNINQQDIAIQQIVEVINMINQGAGETAAGISQTKISTQQLNQVAKILTDLM